MCSIICVFFFIILFNKYCVITCDRWTITTVMDGTFLKNALARLGLPLYLRQFYTYVALKEKKIPIYRVRLAHNAVSCGLSLIFKSARCFILNTHEVA